jgi:hypothetical protein
LISNPFLAELPVRCAERYTTAESKKWKQKHKTKKNEYVQCERAEKTRTA